MSKTTPRADGRSYNQLRPIKVTYDPFEYAAGSVLYEIGKTKILCAVTMQAGVPSFLRGKKSGWLTAEYSLLPASTVVRSARESSSGKRDSRSVEISRMIGRVLRCVVNLEAVGEKTIYIDCDVLQADGGTRTAAITAASMALKSAQTRWLNTGVITQELLTDELAAISVGLINGVPFLDIDCAEDNHAQADFNVVITRTGALAELQGSAEKRAISWAEFESIKQLAIEGVITIFNTVPQDSLVVPSKKATSLSLT
jgi:ribonuclease PH